MRVPLAAGLLLAFAASASAQVYRCEGPASFSDKPCAGARPVDVRPNIMDAGPRMAFQPVVPQPAAVMPVPEAPPSAPSQSIWQRRDSDDAAHTSRTTGTYTPR